MKKVASGQPLRIPASTFNTMVDAASDYQRRSLNRGSSAVPSDTRSGIVLIRNQSGADRDRFSVLGLSSILITPTENSQEFSARYAMNAVLPTNSYTQKFCVLQEPIKSNGLGRAMIVGITPVNVARPSGDTTEYAGVLANQTYLQAGTEGAQILWEDSGGTTPHLALVRLPHMKGGGTGNVSARAATTANIALSGTQTIDGIALAVGDVVLVKNQTITSANGIYKVAAAAWTREGTLSGGMLVSIRLGTTLAETLWMLTTADPITPGTTPLTFKGVGAYYG